MYKYNYEYAMRKFGDKIILINIYNNSSFELNYFAWNVIKEITTKNSFKEVNFFVNQYIELRNEIDLLIVELLKRGIIFHE